MSESAGVADGLFRKFHVSRIDDSPHHRVCRYFVLDLDHDPHAAAFVRLYARTVRSESPELASDLEALFPIPKESPDA